MTTTAANMGTADLRLHTTASDGFAPVDRLLASVALRTRLNVIAITDHDEIDASLWAYQHRDRYPFDIVPGLEVTSLDGHVLALWVTQPVARDMSLADTVAAIHDLGGMAVLAHPFEFYIHRQTSWRYLQQPEIICQAQVDALEVHNGGAFTPLANRLARRAALTLGMPMLSNSDAHSPAAVGSGLTRFKGRSAPDLRQAIASGATQAAYGQRWPLVDYAHLFADTARRKFNLYPETPVPAPNLAGD